MLSPGDYYQQVPTDLAANLEWREYVLKRCEKDRAAQRAMVRYCRDDIIFWINSFTYQFNPNPAISETKRVGPFICWPFQVRSILSRDPARPGALWCYENRRTAVEEKSREVGASWKYLLFQFWLAAFHDDVQILNISRSADAVDSKSRNSLFAKLRFIKQHMPAWLIGKVEDTRFNIKFVRSGSEITGEASTGRAGVGGRASVIFVDEFSQIKEDEQVRQGTASTSDCRFFNGTHLGVGTEFYNLTVTPEIIKLRTHWIQHPEKNQGLYSYDQEQHKLRFWEYQPDTDAVVELEGPKYQYPPDFDFVMTGKPSGGPYPGIRSPWYDKKCLDIGNDRGVAMELDIDPQGAASQFFDSMLIRTLQRDYCQPPSWQGDVEYDRDTGEFRSFVPKPNGPLRLWLDFEDGRIPPSVYVAGCDLSWGTGATNTCLSIVDAQTGERVAEYVTPIVQPTVFGALSVALLRQFQTPTGGTPMLGWEKQGPGAHFAKALIAFGYHPIYYQKTEVNLRFGEATEPGINVIGETKTKLLEGYHIALQRRLFLNRSREALEECLDFQYDARGQVMHPREKAAKDPSGAGWGHADRAIADSIAWKMAEESGLVQKKTQKPADAVPVGSLAWRRQLAEREAELAEYGSEW